MSETKKRGFAAMSAERQREIAQMGGRAVQAEDRTFAKNSELARLAGSLGGKNVPYEKRLFVVNPKAAVKAARKGATMRPDKKTSGKDKPY